MAIIDLDKVGAGDVRKFALNGIEYEIRPITYGQMIELSKLEGLMDKEEDTEKVLLLTIDYIDLVIPDMGKDAIMAANNSQVQRMQELIQEVMSGRDSDDEVAYYRKKYENEYRKNLEGVGESSDE